MSATDYSRHTGTLFDAQRLRTISTVVVGAGALGNEVCRILGLLGVRKVLLIDPDQVESSNLTRSVLLRLEDFLGRNKAEALAFASRRVFPDTQWDCLPTAMADVGLGNCSGADVIFGCVDSDLARIEISVAALRLNIPVVDGGLGADGDTAGRVSLYAGRDCACYVCQLMPGVRARLLAEHFQKRFSCAQEPEVNPDAIASTPGLASMVAALQVDRAVRFLYAPEPERASRSVELRLDGDPAMLPLRISRDPLCPFHSDPGMPIAVGSTEVRFIDILLSVDEPESSIVLDWPVCTLALCRDCGVRWTPRCRLGAFRAHGRCPGCGSASRQVLEKVAQINRHSPFALETVGQFGFSQGHILFVRRPIT